MKRGTFVVILMLVVASVIQSFTLFQIEKEQAVQHRRLCEVEDSLAMMRQECGWLHVVGGVITP